MESDFNLHPGKLHVGIHNMKLCKHCGELCVCVVWEDHKKSLQSQETKFGSVTHHHYQFIAND